MRNGKDFYLTFGFRDAWDLSSNLYRSVYISMRPCGPADGNDAIFGTNVKVRSRHPLFFIQRTLYGCVDRRIIWLGGLA